MFKIFIVATSLLLAFSVNAENCQEIRNSCGMTDDPNARFVQVSQSDCACLTKGADGNIIFPENMPEGVRATFRDSYNNMDAGVRATPDFDPRGAADSIAQHIGDFNGNDCSKKLPTSDPNNPQARAQYANQASQYQSCLDDNARAMCAADHSKHMQECLTLSKGLRNQHMQKANIPVNTPPAQGSNGTGTKLVLKNETVPPRMEVPVLKRKKEYSPDSTEEIKNSYGYSEPHIRCEGELSNNSDWSKALSNNNPNWFEDSMKEFVAKSQNEIDAFHQGGGITAIEFTSWYEKKLVEIKNRTETYLTCTALIQSLQGKVDLNDESTLSGNGTGGKYEVASATKPDLKCVTYMYETVDFKACKAALNAFDGAFIAEQGMGVYQNYDFQSKNMDRQSDLNKKTLQGGTIDTTDALAMQKGAVKDQASVANQRAAFSAAKVGLLATMLAKMPSSTDITDSCEGGNGKATQVLAKWGEIADKFKTTVDNIIVESPSSEEGKLVDVKRVNSSNVVYEKPTYSQSEYSASCGSLQGGGSSTDWTVQLIRNQDIKTKIKAEMIKAGVDMAGNIAKAALLNKQAGEIDDVINSINKFEPPPLPENQMTDMQILECQANPQAENCGTINGRGNVGFSSNGINVGNGQFATSDGQGIDLGNSDGTSANSATSKSDRTGMARKLGGATADAAGDSGILNPVSAAEVKNGGGNPGGGGGGAGATAPGAAAGGGGAGGKPGAGGSGSGGQGLAKMKFSGSSAGSLSWSGGGGLARKPAAKADNPFANLLGKGGSKNGVLDGFRGPASGIGKKEDGLFNMISNRYSQVANDKERLIQYEIKK